MSQVEILKLEDVFLVPHPQRMEIQDLAKHR